MTPTPIKRNKNLVLLSREHHDGLLIVWKIRQGLRFSVQNERIADFVIHVFNINLKPHYIIEEELLFVSLPENDELRLKAEDEHAALKKKVSAMQPSFEATNHLLEQFATLLEDHIRFEERVLYPHIEKEVGSDELERIGLELEKRHKKAKATKWKDEFWVRK